jgi:hypothetical protein
MRLAAILLVFKDQPFIPACLSAIYPVVDSICVVTQYDRTFKQTAIEPDGTVAAVLSFPDPGNKMRLAMRRDLSGLFGNDNESRLRNLGRSLDPAADYYLIVDADEIWETALLREAWSEVQRTRHSAYSTPTHHYLGKWNYRVVPKRGPDLSKSYHPLVFLRGGFRFIGLRRIDWWTLPARFWEYLRLGRKPKSSKLTIPLHHGSGVGDDSRIATKLTNWGHAEDVDPAWFERTWKNLNETSRHLSFFKDATDESVIAYTPTGQLPPEITGQPWPPGWLDERKNEPAA